MEQPKNNLAPAAAIAVSAIFWGLWWLPLRELTELGFGGAAVSMFLNGTLALLSLPWLIIHRRRFRDGGWFLLGAGGVFGAAIICWNTALITGEVVRVTLLFYLAPVWATLLARFLLAEPVGRVRLISIALGLGGAWVLLGADGGLPIPRSVGDWFGLAAGMLFAISMTVARKGHDIDDRDQTVVSFYSATLLAGVAALLLPGAILPPEPVSAIGWAALAAILWMLPTTWMLFWGGRQLDPGKVTILLLLEVVAAAVSAILITGEPFGIHEAAGCTLILAAGAIEGWQAMKSGRNAGPNKLKS
jgi:drug/metabolite transporter (DMT)-like permease